MLIDRALPLVLLPAFLGSSLAPLQAAFLSFVQRHLFLQGVSYLLVTLRISLLARHLSPSQHGQQHMHTGLLSAYTSSFVYKQHTSSILVCGMVCS